MRWTPGAVFAIALAALPSLAPSCAPRNSATLYFDPPSLAVEAGTWFEVDVLASISGSVQAFELAVAVTPTSLTPDGALPHGDFDDDGQLLVAPVIDAGAGTIARIVDFRHGATAVSGATRLATIRLYAHSAGSATLQVTTQGLASPSGVPLSGSSVAAAVTVTP